MKKNKMSDKPQHISPNVWYYENKGSIDLVIEIRDNDANWIRTDMVKIHKYRLQRSLARMN